MESLGRQRPGPSGVETSLQGRWQRRDQRALSSEVGAATLTHSRDSQEVCGRWDPQGEAATLHQAALRRCCPIAGAPTATGRETGVGITCQMHGKVLNMGWGRSA